MRRLHPVPSDDLTDDDLQRAYAFPDDRPWLRANMVATLDGAMRGPDGSSRSISTPADQRVFQVARTSADAILVGAGTIRAEDYRPSARVLAIVTASLHLPLTLRLFAEADARHARPIVLTTQHAADAAPTALTDLVDVVACGPDAVDLSVAVRALHDRGLRRIHCEGGPRLLGDIVAAGLLDELLLTLVPRMTGAAPPDHIVDVPDGFAPPVRMKPCEVLEEDGTVLMRLRRRAC